MLQPSISLSSLPPSFDPVALQVKAKIKQGSEVFWVHMLQLLKIPVQLYFCLQTVGFPWEWWQTWYNKETGEPCWDKQREGGGVFIYFLIIILWTALLCQLRSNERLELGVEEAREESST